MLKFKQQDLGDKILSGIKIVAYLCHRWVRLRMRIVDIALSFFPGILTSQVMDFFKK